MRDLNVEAIVNPLPPREPPAVEVEEDTRCAFTPQELELARQQPNKAVISRPPMLGYASVVLIIVNRMVGECFPIPVTLFVSDQE
jgi:hypothetical protein